MEGYEDLEKICENREKQRAYYIPENKGAYQSLNGEWEFCFFEDGVETEKEYDTIKVPSCWQLLGYESPYYTNVIFPFPVDPPYLPDNNPLGIYKRSFEINDITKKYYIVFEGVSSRLELYINEKYVGCSQGSHLQAEFDVTDFLNKGINTITAKVNKWCSGSYLEDQDQFRYSGIFRDVYILKRPLGHIKDIHITTEENEIFINFDGRATVSLFDKDILLEKKELSRSGSFCVDNPTFWNSEKPYLYRLVFEYENEIITQKVGFVSYKIGEKNEFLVNGTKVKLKGINHHDTNPKTGWYMTDEDMRNDLKLMKSLNINTIRTSHYPPHPKFLNMCDELGFYVMLETDIEMHGFTTRHGAMKFDSENNDFWVSNRPEWEETFIERIERAYERDKNHVSIFSWSIGNESGMGVHQHSMIKWLRNKDKKRLIHSEDASRMVDDGLLHKALTDGDMPDIHSRMYPSMEYIEEYANDLSRKMPLFMCEYCHAMGNGPGELRDYWNIVEKYPNLIGGCIWEWADHIVLSKEGAKYGGDFGELTHDSNFCVDGLVMADRSFKAGTLNAKAVYQNIKCSLDGEYLIVKNMYDFTNLNEFTFNYQVVSNGETVLENSVTLDAEPKEVIRISVTFPKKCSLGVYINYSLFDKNGEEVAGGQLNTMPKYEKIYMADKVKVKDSETDIFSVSVYETKYIFSKRHGLLNVLKNGSNQFFDSPKLSVWRAPTDNEIGIKRKWAWFNPYDSENLDRVLNKIYSCDIIENTVTYNGSLSGIGREPFFKYQLAYSFYADGRVSVHLKGKIRENLIWLPRLGFEFRIPKEYGEFSYFGRGPEENYCDMNEHAKIGMYESNADKEYVPYVMPQEHGNHTDTRLLVIKDSITFEADTTFEFNVSNYDAQSLYKATHSHELKENDFITVRIDYKNSGMGTNSCGPDLSERYRMNDKEIDFKFYIK